MNGANMSGNIDDDSAKTSTHELESEKTGYSRSPVKICLIDRPRALKVKSAELTNAKLGSSFQRATPSPPVLLGSSFKQPTLPQPVPPPPQPVLPPQPVPPPDLPPQPVPPPPQSIPVLINGVVPPPPQNKPKWKPLGASPGEQTASPSQEETKLRQPVETTAELPSSEIHRVLVENLNSDLVDEQLLSCAFGQFGLITGIAMIRDQAHIDFAAEMDALAAVACLNETQLAENVIAVSLQQPEVIDLCSEAGSEPGITSPTPSNCCPSPSNMPRHVVLNMTDADTVQMIDEHADQSEVETPKRRVRLSKKFQKANVRDVFGIGMFRYGRIIKKQSNAMPHTLKASKTSKFKALIARAKGRFKTLKMRKVATALKSTGLFLPSTRRLVRLRTAPRKIKPAAAKNISKAVLEERKLIEESGHRTCCHCLRQFKQAESLISHCHSTGHVVQCDSCMEKFSTPIGYWGHWREVHGTTPIYVCELCDRLSGKGHSLGMAIRHFTSFHLPSLDPDYPREYRCPLCDHVARTPNTLGYHSTQCHNDRGDHVNRVCPRCGVRKRSVYTARMCYVSHFATTKKN